MPDKENFRSLIEKVREANDIVEVVSEHVPLDHSHKALCPFHDEKTPSFHVNARGQYFKCFGCGAGGDVFRFIEKTKNISFIEALRLLADRAGVALKEMSPDDLFQIKENRRVEEVLSAAADYYHARLTPEARAYLHKRGLTDETISRFRIGYASGGLLEHLTGEKSFPVETCLRAGVVKKINGGKASDYFLNRVVFPNIVRDRVVHLSGRVLGDAEPRYLHLPGEMRFFFNEDALRSPRVILTEGVLDCLPAVQSGFECVALFGTSRFREDDLPRLSRAETVYVCMDGDKPGREAASRVAGLIGEKARVVCLPDDTDLGDYFVKNSPADFQKLLDAAPGLVSYEIGRIPADAPKTELPRLLDPVLKLLARLSRPHAEAYIGHEIKERFGLKKEDTDAYRAAVREYRSRMEKEKSSQEGEGTSSAYLWEDFEPFNPAQDFRQGKAYFTVHVQRRDPKDGSIERLPCVITSDREMFPLEKSELDARGLRLLREGQAPSDMSRWSTSDTTKNSVHAFLNGEASVDPVALFDEIRALFVTYLDYPDPLYHDFITLWCLGTYFFMGFESYPCVFLSGTKCAGKTRTIEVADPLCFNSIMSASMTDAVMFRSTETDRCTLFHDEAVKFSRKQAADLSERLEIFNSGYKRSGSVRRCVGDDNIPTTFSTYSPKLLANINGLEPTSADRTIILHLLRAKGEVPKFSYRRLEGTFQALRNSLYILALTYHEEIGRIYADQEIVKGLKDREDELWSPIFALAEFIDGYRLEKDPSIADSDLLMSRMIRLAFTCRDRKQDDELEENPEQRILAAVVDFLGEHDPIRGQDGDPTDFYTSDDVLTYISGRDTLDWVKKRYLGKVLCQLQIIKDKKKDKPYLRVEGGSLVSSGKQVLCYRLARERVTDVAERYLVSGPVSETEKSDANDDSQQ